MKTRTKPEGVCDGKYCRTFVKNGDGITVVTPDGDKRYCHYCYRKITEAGDETAKEGRIEDGR